MENKPEETKIEEPTTEFTKENPHPDSNHDWYNQFQPDHPEYHGSLDRRDVPYGYDQTLPTSMPTEHKAGMTEAEAIAQVDPTKDDPVVIEIQAGHKFCGDLKKRLTEFSKAIQTRGELITKKKGETFVAVDCAEKEYKCMGPSNVTQMEELKAWIVENTKNPHVDDMSGVLGEFWKAVDNLGTDVESIKTVFNVEFTKTTRAVFKVQQATMAKLKARKKELTTAAKAQE